jgi:hypothetical protein
MKMRRAGAGAMRTTNFFEFVNCFTTGLNAWSDLWLNPGAAVNDGSEGQGRSP